MALDTPVVTHNLPDPFGNPGPMPDADTALMQQFVDIIIGANGRFATIVIDAVGDMSRLSWVAAMFCGVGVVAVVCLGLSYTLHTVNTIREQRRHGRVAERLARLAWDELSPADILYAEREWPQVFALARYIDGRNSRNEVRDRWLDPALRGRARIAARWQEGARA